MEQLDPVNIATLQSMNSSASHVSVSEVGETDNVFPEANLSHEREHTVNLSKEKTSYKKAVAQPFKTASTSDHGIHSSRPEVRIHFSRPFFVCV